MAENDGRLLALFDELSTFLTKIRLYSSRGLTDSHELSMFLELYNANPWIRTTGIKMNQLLYLRSMYTYISSIIINISWLTILQSYVCTLCKLIQLI